MKASMVALSFVVGSAVAQSGSAQTLITWDTSAASGSTVSITATESETNFSGSDLVRGSGLSVVSGTGVFSSSGFSGTDADDYVQFGFTVDSGVAANLGNFTITTSTSNTGPGTLGLYSSTDDYASTLYTFNQSETSSIDHTIDLSSMGSLTGIVLFRIFEIGDTQADGDGATASGGSFRVADLVIEGSISAVPEPSTYAALAGVAALGLAAFRRRNRNATTLAA